jgi:putative ABC transport system substrate-binding protein
MSGKWLQLFKEIAPGVTRVAVSRDPSLAVGPALFAVIQAAAPSLGVELHPFDVRDEGEIEHAITAFAQSPNSLIVTGGPPAASHRDLIITLAARHRLPAVYNARFWAVAGG